MVTAMVTGILVTVITNLDDQMSLAVRNTSIGAA